MSTLAPRHLLTMCSLTTQRVPTAGSSNVTQTMPKSFSSLAGYTTNKAPTTLVRNRLLSTLRNQWPLVSVVSSSSDHVRATNCLS